jgi:glycosyltransferase involved in cell wall biosynthesis
VSEKARILVTASTFPRWKDDTEPQFVYELCKQLVKHGFDIDVLAPHAEGARSREIMDGINVYRYSYFISKYERLSYNGGILANLKINKFNYMLVPFFLIAQVFATWRRMSDKEYDLIHAHWLIPQGFIAVFISRYLFKQGPKILCTSHGGDLFAFQLSFFRRIKKWVLSCSDGVTVVSEHMRKVCLQITNIEEKIYVCSMGVDLVDGFIPVENIERHDNTILFVGRLVEKKGVSILLDATHKIIQKYPEIKLLIVGDGPERHKLEIQCKELNITNSVEFIGALRKNELPAIYSSASIAVMPSIIDSRNDQEGLGLVAIEAMGCECAVIASSLPAVDDIIESGINGILVKHGNSVELENAIDLLLSDKNKRTQIASSGRKSVIEKFDWKTVQDRYAEIVRTIVHN